MRNGISHTRPPGRLLAAGMCFTAYLLASACAFSETDASSKAEHIKAIPGLVTFIDFSHTVDGVWRSQGGSMPDLPVYLRRIGDDERYGVTDWPYSSGPSELRFDDSGPFGHALRCNQGYIYAEIPRVAFDGAPLDIHGRRSGTLVAWMKFTGSRHFVAGIWDEGGWDPYQGRRQYALFGGLFGTRGITAHISATGAASYPQSTASGSQYARKRALDGADFPNDRWVTMAMTWDADTGEVTAWLDGVATPKVLTDPVAEDALQPEEPLNANPYHFPWPMYSPRAFILKFNGYNAADTGIAEHWLECDLENRRITYGRHGPRAELATGAYEIAVDYERDGDSLLPEPLVAEAVEGATLTLPQDIDVRDGDQVVATLNRNGEQVGTTVRRSVRPGAPFTFGRALGLGEDENIAHGSELAIDGVAVYDRPLSEEELQSISFTAEPPGE